MAMNASTKLGLQAVAFHLVAEMGMLILVKNVMMVTLSMEMAVLRTVALSLASVVLIQMTAHCS